MVNLLAGWRLPEGDGPGELHGLLGTLGAAPGGRAGGGRQLAPDPGDPMGPVPPARGAAWASSGVLALTGCADGPPELPARDHLARIEALLAAARALAATAGRPLVLDRRVLGERAALSGLRRAGATSPGGSTRLLPAADGWLAVCLARDDDVAAIPAWLGVDEPPGDPWPVVAGAVARRAAGEVVVLAQELGIAVAALPVAGAPPDEQALARGPSTAPVRVHAAGAHGVVPDRPLVVDLSSLWAGPLCAHVLGLAGARVVKVEGVRRPDGARRGPRGVYARLHAGHEAVALDLATADGRRRLVALLEAADVVIEGSRPRALEQLDIEPAAILDAHPGATWVSITAYGRTGPWRQRVGFGDDVAAAAGVLAGSTEAPRCCGDALADPIAGLVAAVGVLGAWLGGGGVHVDVALREAAAWVAAAPVLQGPVVGGRGPDGAHRVHDVDGTATVVAAPTPRPAPTAPVADLGADTVRVLAGLA